MNHEKHGIFLNPEIWMITAIPHKHIKASLIPTAYLYTFQPFLPAGTFHLRKQL
jgi:hypothetical protein